MAARVNPHGFHIQSGDSRHGIPAALQHLALPVIASPMFIVSYPELVLAQCKAGIVGSFPALNARPAELLDEWLTQIQARESRRTRRRIPTRRSVRLP